MVRASKSLHMAPPNLKLGKTRNEQPNRRAGLGFELLWFDVPLAVAATKLDDCIQCALIIVVSLWLRQLAATRTKHESKTASVFILSLPPIGFHNNKLVGSSTVMHYNRH